MNERVNPFADLREPRVFTTKPKAVKPVEKETIERFAEENNFPSRQAPKVTKSQRESGAFIQQGAIVSST